MIAIRHNGPSFLGVGDKFKMGGATCTITEVGADGGWHLPDLRGHFRFTFIQDGEKREGWVSLDHLERYAE